MKIAVTYEKETGNVFQHFGRTQWFKLFDICDGTIIGSAVVDNGGFGHHDLATYLKQLGVQTLILGNRGQGAIDALNAAGITQVAGVTGSADAAAQSFAAGTLVGNPNARCQHHGEHHHSEGHSENKMPSIKL